VKGLKMVKAIVFDLDNTLVQSHIDYVSLKLTVLKALAEAGVPDRFIDPKDPVVENYIRGKTFLQGHSSESTLIEFDRRLDLALMEIEMERADQVREIEGAHSLVSSLRAKGFEVGILTRGSRSYAMAILARTGFDGQIAHVVCRDDYPLEEAKPNPLAMDRIAEKLGCRSEECVFIGDHPMDLECAKASGAGFIGVLTGSTDREKWRLAGCETVLDSIADVPQWMTRNDVPR
jgi:HAD superfamily hydrolase (TIGR01549 family)